MTLGKERILLRCDLKRAARGDGSPWELTDEERKKVVWIEFLFRAEKKAKVTLGDLGFTDLEGTEEEGTEHSANGEEEKRPARADTCLPT